MDFLERVLANDFSANAKTLNTFDPIAREKARAFEPTRRAIHNLSPPIARYGFSEECCRKHQNPFVSKILKALRKSGLEGYSLHCGKAFSTRYSGPNLSLVEEASEEIFETRNTGQGFRLQFRIVEETAFGPCLHVLFLIREKNEQGSFFAVKRMLVAELWKRVLEPAGFAFLYGRAVWSGNSEIRHSCPRSKDWREVLCYVGLDKALQPILIPGLRLFYYRLGFVQMDPLGQGIPSEYVALLSEATEQKIRDSVGVGGWNELTRFDLSNARSWKERVSEREALLGHEELENRIAAESARLSQKPH
jgi:hypothetical protein